MKIRIVVAAHKPYSMPQDPVYLPVQAGSALHEPLGFTGDDSGDEDDCDEAADRRRPGLHDDRRGDEEDCQDEHLDTRTCTVDDAGARDVEPQGDTGGTDHSSARLSIRSM